MWSPLETSYYRGISFCRCKPKVESGNTLSQDHTVKRVQLKEVPYLASKSIEKLTFGHLMPRAKSLEKTLMLGKTVGRKRRG